MSEVTRENVNMALRRFEDEADRSLINYDHTTCALLKGACQDIRTYIAQLEQRVKVLKDAASYTIDRVTAMQLGTAGNDAYFPHIINKLQAALAQGGE